jgi:hypothetical protein
MSQQGNFIGGFLLGTVVGGAVGGVIGALAASRLKQGPAEPEGSFSKLDKTESKPTRRRQLKAPTEQNMEVARRGLEDKIAQLNEAIDDVRQQLGTVNGTSVRGNGEQVVSQDP